MGSKGWQSGCVLEWGQNKEGIYLRVATLDLRHFTHHKYVIRGVEDRPNLVSGYSGVVFVAGSSACVVQ
jgi:hypothetical protein